MGDHVHVQLPVPEIHLGLTSQPVQLSLAIPLWIGAMSTSHPKGTEGLWQGSKVINSWCMVAVKL